MYEILGVLLFLVCVFAYLVFADFIMGWVFGTKPHVTQFIRILRRRKEEREAQRGMKESRVEALEAQVQRLAKKRESANNQA